MCERGAERSLASNGEALAPDALGAGLEEGKSHRSATLPRPFATFRAPPTVVVGTVVLTECAYICLVPI